MTPLPVRVDRAESTDQVLLIGVCGLGIAQAYYLNVGLARFRALDFVPTYTALMMLIGSLTGLVFDQEYKLLNTAGWVMFAFGLLLVCIGLVIISWKPDPEANQRSSFDRRGWAGRQAKSLRARSRLYRHRYSQAG